MGFEYSTTVVGAIFATALLVISWFFAFRTWRIRKRENPYTNMSGNTSKQDNMEMNSRGNHVTDQQLERTS
ncbi:hypothetical protein ElyMa_000454800 [Elysia marginata]|uniref:Uncharacterized protein n=1 Tax=Elysia marginata TaxID=1093978 RepID=A0AAV4FQ19_9GAST|nr:hypothetical protein ElyMa_000454800 [Elysia marginata]